MIDNVPGAEDSYVAEKSSDKKRPRKHHVGMYHM